MSNELKACPCGNIPKTLCIAGGDRDKYMHVYGDCCSEWEIEFRTGYAMLNDPELLVDATEAWNNASRPSKPKEEEPKTKIAEDDSMLLIAEGQLLGYYLSSCGTSIREVVDSMGLEKGEWDKLSGRVNLKDADREEIEEYFLAICDEVTK